MSKLLESLNILRFYMLDMAAYEPQVAVNHDI